LLSSRAHTTSDDGGDISVGRESYSPDGPGKRDEELELDRRESRSMAHSRSESERETNVRVTGLVARLTSPSRYNNALVDIWFAIERRERTAEWDQAFAAVAEGWRPDPQHPSHFGLLSYHSSIALIVARQVSPHPAVWQHVEEEARALVSRVNHVVTEAHAPVAAGHPLADRRASASASRRWVHEATQALRGLVPKPQIPVSQGSSTGIR
jgi:hypothetical protein